MQTGHKVWKRFKRSVNCSDGRICRDFRVEIAANFISGMMFAGEYEANIRSQGTRFFPITIRNPIRQWRNMKRRYEAANVCNATLHEVLESKGAERGENLMFLPCRNFEIHQGRLMWCRTNAKTRARNQNLHRCATIILELFR